MHTPCISLALRLMFPTFSTMLPDSAQQFVTSIPPSFVQFLQRPNTPVLTFSSQASEDDASTRTFA